MIVRFVVSRAGGDIAGNIARWQGQFEGSPTGQRSDKTVHDMKVTTVQIDGTFSNTAQLAAGESGIATANTTDWWGLNSNTATFIHALLASLTAEPVTQHQWPRKTPPSQRSDSRAHPVFVRPLVNLQ